MKKFVQITNSGNVAIRVTMGLGNINATNVYSPAKDRLSVKPAWTKTSVLIVPGMGLYPSEIKEWSTVKAYIKSHVFALSGETDGEGFSDDIIQKAEAEKKRLQNAMKKYEADLAKNEEILKADEERGRRNLTVK